MNFGTFLGNSSLKERLSASLSRNRLSHCYLITGPEGSGKKTLSLLLAAAMECESGGDRPCLHCNSCRKVLSGTHPDVITVQKRKDRKTMGVDVIREVCSDLYIRPNEGQKKIYIFPCGSEITTQAQNALLKGIEEPPEYGVFLFLAEQADHLLETIRSRSAELKLSPLPSEVLEAELEMRCPEQDTESRRAAAARSGGYLGQALKLLSQTEELPSRVAQLLDAFARKDRLGLVSAACAMERLKRDELLEQFFLCRKLLNYALSAPALHPMATKLAQGRSRRELLTAAESFGYGLELLRSNVSPAHTCGTLMISLDMEI